MIYFILAVIILYETYVICRQQEKIERIRKRLTDMKGETVALRERLKKEQELTAHLLQEEIVVQASQKPFKNWLAPVIGRSEEDEEND
jgi:predicted Holliday junction resolvase-like endonuclease